MLLLCHALAALLDDRAHVTTPSWALRMPDTPTRSPGYGRLDTQVTCAVVQSCAQPAEQPARLPARLPVRLPEDQPAGLPEGQTPAGERGSPDSGQSGDQARRSPPEPGLRQTVPTKAARRY
jgi:hypothetical protein